MRGIAAVWLRDFLYFRKAFVQSLLWAAMEPLFTLFAIGFALGKSISNFEGVRYIDFYLPAALTSTAMMVAYFEGSFGAFTKLSHQKTYATILLTPVSSRELIVGEILWGATKGVFGFGCMMIVAGLFGVLPEQGLLPSFLILVLVSLMFSTLGMLMVSFAKNYDSFSYSISGLIVPMSLFSGTYFPLKDLPDWVQKVAWVLPLTHCVHAVRNIMLGRSNPLLFLNVLMILILTSVAGYWAIRRVSAKLEN